MTNNKYIEQLEKDKTLKRLEVMVGNKFPEYKGDDAKDIVQNAVMKFLKYYDENKGYSPKTALYRFTIQSIIDFGKQNKVGGFSSVYESVSSYLDTDESKNGTNKELPAPPIHSQTNLIEMVTERGKLTGKQLETLLFYTKQRLNDGELDETGQYTEATETYLKRILMNHDLMALNNNNNALTIKPTYQLPKPEIVHQDISKYLAEFDAINLSPKTYLHPNYIKRMASVDPINRAYMQQAVNLTYEQQKNMPRLYNEFLAEENLNNEERKRNGEKEKMVAKKSEIPIMGAVLLNADGKIIAQAYKGIEDSSIKQHCEFILFEQVLTSSRRQEAIDGTLFVTLEPCDIRGNDKIPCAVRCVMMQLRKVYIGNLSLNDIVKNEGVNILKSGEISFNPQKYEAKNNKSSEERCNENRIAFLKMMEDEFGRKPQLIREEEGVTTYRIGEPIDVLPFHYDLYHELLVTNSDFQKNKAPRYYH